MRLPDLSVEDLEQLIPGVTVVGPLQRGGQKLVFETSYCEAKCAVKAMLISAEALESSCDDEFSDDEAVARAEREVEILGDISNRNLVSLGPIPFQVAEIRGQRIVIFSEEWLAGGSLSDAISAESPMEITEVLNMAKCVSSAICSLWENSKIHRDIKPGNIVKRSDCSEYVLLDMGLAFDVGDSSITPSGFIVGTPQYYSPDQVIRRPGRRLDFRSDFYSLGIVIYEALTGVHPFASPLDSTEEIVSKILEGHTPEPPSSKRADIPTDIDDLVIRLLQPRPHQRYRTCQQVVKKIEEIEQRL